MWSLRAKEENTWRCVVAHTVYLNLPVEVLKVD